MYGFRMPSLPGRLPAGRLSLALVVCLAAAMSFGIVTAHEDEMMHASASPAAFEKLKTLVGEWEGTSPQGAPLRISYHLTGAGTALIAELSFPDDPRHNMTTVYHAAGDDVMLTHYCAAGNQPRMVSSGWNEGDGRLVFEFKDGTNLDSPAGGYMHHLEIEFEDGDTYIESWTYRSGGEDAPPMVLKLHRKS